MNIKQIATGVLSGYASKAIHLVASIAVVPFLLDSDVLGPADYGRSFSILAIPSVIGILCAGFHSAADRAVARAVGRSANDGGRSVAAALGSGTKVLTLASFSVIVPTLLLAERTLAFVGVPSEAQYRWALVAASGIAFLENAFYLVRSPLIARGDLAYLNLVLIVEVVGRTASVFLWFSIGEASVASFLGLQAAFTLVRVLALFFRLRRSDVEGLFGAPIAAARETIRYAGPVSLAEGSIVAVRILPVTIASRLLGPTEAGWVAIVVNTLQGYFLQIFFAIVQPMAVPIASRFALVDDRSPRRKGFFELESAYVFVVVVVFAQLIYWTPLAIPLWLGSDFDALILPTQIMLAGSGVQTSAIVRRSVLIGQGAVAEMAPIMIVCAISTLVLVGIGIAAFDSWIAVVVASTSYLVASNAIGVDRVFARLFRNDEVAGALSRLAGIGLIYSCAIAASRVLSPHSLSSSIAGSLVALVVSLALGFRSFITPARVAMLGRRLYHHRGVDLFD